MVVRGIFFAQGVSPLVEINRNKNAAICKDILENNLLSYAEETMLQDWRF